MNQITPHQHSAIDAPLYIPRGKEHIFEHKKILLEADITSEGTLIFKDCVIDTPKGHIHSKGRHGRKFCVSVLRQNQEWHEINVHTWGRDPLTNPVPGGWMVCAPLAA